MQKIEWCIICGRVAEEYCVMCGLPLCDYCFKIKQGKCDSCDETWEIDNDDEFTRVEDV